MMTTWLQCDCVFLHVSVTSLKEFAGEHKHTYTTAYIPNILQQRMSNIWFVTSSTHLVLLQSNSDSCIWHLHVSEMQSRTKHYFGITKVI